MERLNMTHVSRCLDKKMKIGGFEIPDLIVVLLYLGISNFFFGQTSFRLFVVWIPTIVFLFLIKFIKRGKPDNYIFHVIRYWIISKKFSSFRPPSQPFSKIKD